MTDDPDKHLTQTSSLRNNKPEIDFRYFISLALCKEMSWNALGNLLEDLTQTLSKSKELNKILLEELQASEESKKKDEMPNSANVKQLSEVKSVGNEVILQNINDVNLDAQEDEIFSDQMKNVTLNFEYDFVGTNGIETKRLTVNSLYEDKVEETNFENLGMSEREVDYENIASDANRFNPNIDGHILKKSQISNDLVDRTKEKKIYQCQKCDKRFVTKRSLKRHKNNMHMEQKPFTCNTCSKAFSVKNDLERHYLIHTGEKQFECKTCNKRFAQIGNLRTHERIHMGIKPFECKICKKAFSRKHALKCHDRIHKPF